MTIRCTCALSAAPKPQTAFFTRAGAYSEHALAATDPELPPEERVRQALKAA